MVYLMIDKKSKTLYALEIQDKLMASLNHHFMCKLFNCFQDDIFLCMVVEYGEEGGDLLSAIGTNHPEGFCSI